MRSVIKGWGVAGECVYGLEIELSRYILEKKGKDEVHCQIGYDRVSL